MAKHSADDQANPANKPRNHPVRGRRLIGHRHTIVSDYMSSDDVAMLTGRLPDYDLEPFIWALPAQLVELILPPNLTRQRFRACIGRKLRMLRSYCSV
jgi:hypothetical protein